MRKLKSTAAEAASIRLIRDAANILSVRPPSTANHPAAARQTKAAVRRAVEIRAAIRLQPKPFAMRIPQRIESPPNVPPDKSAVLAFPD